MTRQHRAVGGGEGERGERWVGGLGAEAPRRERAPPPRQPQAGARRAPTSR